MSIHAYPLGSIADSELRYAVTVARFGSQYLFCRHRERATWECPGGLPSGSEMAEARLFETPPASWIYPEIVPWLLKQAQT